MEMNKVVGQWIECAVLAHGTVSAKRVSDLDDDAEILSGTVRISYRNTGHEADGLDEIREVVEAALGDWIETPSMSGWSAAEGEDEIVQEVDYYPYQPTHEIVFTPSGGKPRVTKVHLFDGEVAYTRSEMDTEDKADWEIDENGQWLCQGQATPGGANGTVEIREINRVTNG